MTTTRIKPNKISISAFVCILLHWLDIPVLKVVFYVTEVTSLNTAMLASVNLESLGGRSVHSLSLLYVFLNKKTPI